MRRFWQCLVSDVSRGWREEEGGGGRGRAGAGGVKFRGLKVGVMGPGGALSQLERGGGGMGQSQVASASIIQSGAGDEDA